MQRETIREKRQGDLMLVQQVESVKQKIYTDFVYPQYKKNCISKIPSTILHLFEGENEKTASPLENAVKLSSPEKVNKVVLLVIDGFGFNQFLNHYKGNRFLASLTNKGQVFPLTSVFPSQTTNALTTLNTGLTPQEHGLFEKAPPEFHAGADLAVLYGHRSFIADLCAL